MDTDSGQGELCEAEALVLTSKVTHERQVHVVVTEA